jgi:protein TonB
MFGGQLLGGASTAEAPPTGSKKGLIIGIAAVVALLIGGGVWYGKQPGNFLAPASTPSRVLENSAPDTTDLAAQPAAIPASASSAQPIAGGQPTQPKPINSVPSISREATPASVGNPVARNTAPVEEPKKPLLGDVRLATPNVSRSDDSAAGEAAPAIENAQPTAAGDSLTGMASSNPNGPAAPLPIGGDVKTAHLLKATPPVYPPNARTQHISGDVKIDALIDASGTVTSTKVISGPTILHQSAMAAVKQWKYEPAQLDGKPTAMHLTVTVQFRLQ